MIDWEKVNKEGEELLKKAEKARDVLDYIGENYPQYQNFYFDLKLLGMFLDFLEQEEYKSFMFNFGINYTLCILRYYESKEDFEKCSKIVTAIKEMNNILGELGDLSTYDFMDTEKALEKLRK